MTFSLLIAFAAISILLKPPKAVRLQRPAVLLRTLKNAGQIFGMISFSYFVSWAAGRFFSSYADLTPGLILVLIFLLGNLFKYPVPLRAILFCVWAYLESQPAASALIKGVVISLGEPFMEWAVDGIRFRLALTSAAKVFSALPGLLLILSLVTLVCSGFFIN